MPNLRIVSDNAADRATLTTTPSAVAGLGVDHLRTDIKSQVCRVLGDTMQIVATWDVDEVLGCVAIPTCNLSSESTIRVRAYADTAGSSLVLDTGVQYAAPGVMLASWDFTQDLNVNAFWDGAATVAAWFDHLVARRIEVDIEDPLRTHLDLARLVAGRYFEPKYNAAYGTALSIEDTSTNTRAESGDIKTDLGTRHRVLSINLDWVDAIDRHRAAHVLREGVGRRHFVSLTPDSVDPGIEQDTMFWGVLRQLGDLAYSSPTLHQTHYQLQEW